jgi:outer membrane protein assembly factor BamD (BamD/ComL family)
MRESVCLVVMLILGSLLLSSCETPPEPSEIPELTRQEFFQKGQEAVESRRFRTALVYYTEFINRYPENQDYILAAEYEIAFIYYKMGEYDEARTRFENIVLQYEDDVREELPRWPLILSERLLGIIDERTGE